MPYPAQNNIEGQAPETMNSNSPYLSVVIPAFNEERGLLDSLKKIREALFFCPELSENYEIIVCNNGSSDGTATIAEQFGCKVVFESVNQVSKARNKGASKSTAQWLLFIDADSWPSPKLMQDITPLLSDPRCMGCGSTIEVVDGPKWFKFVWESKNWSMRLFKWCPGGFILCRRSAFNEVGQFSEEYHLFEELDFVRRIKKLAANLNQRFFILHKHPFCSSGRRGSGKGFWWWAKVAFKLSFFRGDTVKDKTFAKKYYEGER